jgi:hypothetical protein
MASTFLNICPGHPLTVLPSRVEEAIHTPTPVRISCGGSTKGEGGWMF